MPRLRRQLLVMRWGSIVGPILLTAVFAWGSWQRIEREGWDQAASRSQLVGEYLRRTIDGQAVQLAAAERAHDLLALSPSAELALHRFLAGLVSEAGGGGIGLVAPNGDLKVSSTLYPATGNYADRPYLRPGPPDELMVDRLTTRPGGSWSLVAARRARGSPPAGVWVARLDVEAIEDFLRGLAPPDSGDAASVWGADGRVLLRNIPITEPTRLAPESMAMRATSGGVAHAAYETESYVDGVRRLYSSRRLANSDLYASFGVSVDRLRAAWMRQVMIAAALLGACGAVAYGVARQAGRTLDVEATRAAHEFDRKLLAEARKTADNREIMLRELNHRINNNLQMIQSLIRLQKSRGEGPDLDEISARILAIARIHDLLYKSGASFAVDLASLLDSVAASSALVPPERGIRVECALEEVEVDASLATPLALAVTELITNAVKHAFDEGSGVIRLELRRAGEDVEILVSDDGRGLGAASGRHSGGRLVEALVRQIGGRIEMTEAEPGAARPGSRARIVFPLASPAEA